MLPSVTRCFYTQTVEAPQKYLFYFIFLLPNHVPEVISHLGVDTWHINIYEFM